MLKIREWKHKIRQLKKFISELHIQCQWRKTYSDLLPIPQCKNTLYSKFYLNKRTVLSAKLT